MATAFVLLSMAIRHLYEIERHSQVDRQETGWTATTTTRATTMPLPPSLQGGPKTSAPMPKAGPNSGPSISASAASTGFRPAAPVTSLLNIGQAARPRPTLAATLADEDRPVGPTSPVPYRRPPLDS